MNIDALSEAVDDFLKKNYIQLRADFPEGTLQPRIKTNTGLGGAIEFYIMLYTLIETFRHLQQDLKETLDWEKKEQIIDGILELVKGELMKVEI